MVKRTKKNLSPQSKNKRCDAKQNRKHQSFNELQNDFSNNKLNDLLKNTLLVLNIMENEINLKMKERQKKKIFSVDKVIKDISTSKEQQEREEFILDEFNPNHLRIIQLKNSIKAFQENQPINPYVK